MKIEKSLVSGSMMLLILRLLEEKDMYGYEMIEALREKSQNVFELKAGTLYPLLHGLEEKNFVTSYEQKVMGKERKYYRLTAAGPMYWRWRDWDEKRRISAVCDGSDPL